MSAGEIKNETEIKDVVKEKYAQAALRVTSGGSCCCGASPRFGERLLRPHHLEPLRRLSGRPNPRRGVARFARLREPDGARHS